MAVDLRRDDWTLADLARLPEDEYRYEIIDGELVVSPPPTNFHQRVATEMIRRWQPATGVLTHASGVSLPTGRYRERFLIPDVLVVRNGVSSPYYAPSDVLVAVEIVSPSSVTRDRWAKRGLYAELGIPEYWLIDPGKDLDHLHPAVGGGCPGVPRPSGVRRSAAGSRAGVCAWRAVRELVSSQR
jgi:Uma2 family endonuclease